MGKGARNREQYSETREEMKIQAVVEEAKKKKSKFIKSVVAAVVAVVVVASVLVYTFVFANGSYLRGSVVGSANNIQIDNAMMTYYAKSTYANMQSQYGDYFSMVTGIDTTKSLKGQMTSDGKTSWFDTMMESTLSSVSNIVYLALEAEKNGVSLTEDELQMIADDSKLSHEYFLQNGVTTDDIRKCNELSYLAQKYLTEYVNALEITDSEITSSYEKNEPYYKTVATYGFTINYAEDQGEGFVPYTKEEAMANIEKLGNVESAVEFVALAKDMIAEQKPEISDEDLDAAVSSLFTKAGTYQADNELAEWCFDEERAEGDTRIDEDEENEMYTVTYIEQPATRNENGTKIMRHILVANDSYSSSEELDAKVQEIYDLYKADQTEENFAKLAKEYTEDTASQSVGGLYEDVAEGSMVETIDEWLFDDARELGDTELIETDYGTHIVYFGGEGREIWAASVVYDIKTEKQQEYLKELADTYEFVVDDAKIQDIPL